MSEADRPGGDGTKRDGAGLRVFRGGRARGIRPQPASPRDVARRLSALERRVEKALGGGPDVAADRFRTLADHTLAALANARRLTRRDLQALLEEIEHGVGDGVLEALYRYWWRVETVGLDRVPAEGPAIVVTNRGGALLPYEAFMLRTALAGDHPGQRRAYPVIDDWLAALPVVGPALVRAGAIRGATATLRRLLERGEVVILSPEGSQLKSFRDRYRLAQFGRATFARVAIETGAPIVPIAVIGAEEVHPVLARLPIPGRPLGLPALAVTPNLVPLPTKWLMLAGEPLDVAARHPRAAASDPARVARLRTEVRERLQALILEGLRRRRWFFFRG